MAKTFGELVLECQNFEYSKENYELTKECYEIQLMSQYIESQEFMVENMTDIREEFSEFNESYFCEAASSESMNTIYEAFNKKSDNIFKRMWNGLKNLWKRICNFFSRIFGKSKKNTATAEETIKALEVISQEIIMTALEESSVKEISSDTSANEEVKEEPKQSPEKDKEDTSKETNDKTPAKKKPANLNKNEVGALRKIVKSAWKDEYTSAGFTIAPNQPFINKIENSNSWKKLKKKKSGNAYVVDMMMAAMSTESIVIKTNGNVKVLPIHALVSIYGLICNMDSYEEKDATAIKNKIANELKHTIRSGIEIMVDPENLDEIKRMLDEVNSKMESFMKESTDDEVDINVAIFTEASKAQKRREKKAAQQAAGGAKPRENNTTVYKNDITVVKNAEDAKNVAVNMAAMKEVYSELVVISGNMMKMLTMVENYRAEACRGIKNWAVAAVK